MLGERADDGGSREMTAKERLGVGIGHRQYSDVARCSTPGSEESKASVRARGRLLLRQAST